VVIIGSGVTGAFAARDLSLQADKKRVVMLEAREACWGATGRVSYRPYRNEARRPEIRVTDPV